MSPGLHILAAVLDGIAGVVLVYWGIALFRVIRTWQTIPTARAGIRLAQERAAGQDAPGLCLIIPAHNEEGPIAGLVRSLRAQDYPRFHTVLCLDRCTDR